MWGDLHEMKEIELQLDTAVNPGSANRVLRSLGFALHYDIYSYDSPGPNNWQSESLLYVSLFLDTEEVDAQSRFDRIVFHYPFATRASSDQPIALDLVESVAKETGADILYNGSRYIREATQSDWDECAAFLLREWGEEPGSLELRRMIEENGR